MWSCEYCGRTNPKERFDCAGCAAPLRNINHLNSQIDGEKIYCPDPNRYGRYLEIGTVKPKPPKPSTVYR